MGWLSGDHCSSVVGVLAINCQTSFGVISERPWERFGDRRFRKAGRGLSYSRQGKGRGEIPVQVGRSNMICICCRCNNPPFIGPKCYQCELENADITIIQGIPLLRIGPVFKNSDDEKLFERALATYRQEFGPENLIIYLPRRVCGNLSENLVHDPMIIKFWKKNLYSIRVREMSAGYDLVPND